MRPIIMITDAGVHPPEKWATESARTIADLIEVDEFSASDAAIAARKAKPRFQLAISDVLEELHRNVQENERKALAEGGDAHLWTPCDPNDGHIDTVEEASAAIAAAAKGTPFETWAVAPETQSVIRNIIVQHFGVSMDIERAAWADKNGAGNASVERYHAVRAAHGPRHVHLHRET